MMASNIYSEDDDEKVQGFTFIIKGEFFDRKSRGGLIGAEIEKILRVRLHNPGISVLPFPVGSPGVSSGSGD